MEEMNKLFSTEQRAALEGLPMPLCVLHITAGVFQVVLISDGMCRLVQRDRPWIRKQMNEAPETLIHPDDLERVEAEDARAFSHPGDDYVVNCRILTAGGFKRVSIRGNARVLEDGSLLFFHHYSGMDEIDRQNVSLTESRQLFSEAVSAARLIVWEYDIDTHTIRMSDHPVTREEAERFGYGMVIENVPEALAAYVDERSMADMRQMYREVDAGRDATCEAWYKGRPGIQPRCERVIYTVITDPVTQKKRAFAIGQNITADKKAEERYAQEQKHLRENKEYNLMAKGRFNLTANVIMEYTAKQDGLYNMAPGQTYDQAVADFVAAAWSDGEGDSLRQTLSRANLMDRYKQGWMRTTARYRRAVPDGPPLWFSLIVHTYIMPVSGDMEGFFYAYDITWQKQTDEVMDFIASIAFDYIGLIYANTNTFEFIRKSPDVAFGKLRTPLSYTEGLAYVRNHFVDDDEADRFYAATALPGILAGLEGHGTHTVSYLRREGGRLLCKQLHYSWLDRDAGIILAVRSDASAAYTRNQQQVAEIQAARREAERANRAKSSFLSNMSHDLRTPLGGVIGYTDAALEEADAGKKQDYLKKIKRSGELLLDLVNDTLDLSRIESGKMVLEPEIVDSAELGATVLEVIRPVARDRGIHLVAEVDRFPRGWVRVDRLKLQKVILNLLSNAVKYTPPGGTVRYEVAVIDPPEDGCSRRYIVSDDGIGMGADFLENLYEPFAQEMRPEARNVTGTGLGLAIVKRIVDLMKGTIRVESAVGRGTTFTVDLPVPLVGEGGIAATEAKPDLLPVLSGRRVLLCEDYAMNAEIAAILLADAGVEVEAAPDGQTGLELFRSHPAGYYDAILMDLHMPVMDGYGAAQAIRALPRPDGQSVPIIAMSGDLLDRDSKRFQTSGMDGFIAKPFDRERLLAELAAGIGRRGSGD